MTIIAAVFGLAATTIGFAPSAAADTTTTTTSPEAVTVTAQPTPAPAEACNERVDASVNGQTTLVRNWNSDKACEVSAIAYTRDGETKFPQTRVNIDTATVPPMGQVTLSFGNSECVQKDVIYGSDAPATLTGNYFTPKGTLITADDSGLWLEGCESTPTTTAVPPTTAPPSTTTTTTPGGSSTSTPSTQPPSTTTNPPTITVSTCGPTSPYWNTETGTCQLPFTGSQAQRLFWLAFILIEWGFIALAMYRIWIRFGSMTPATVKVH